MLRRFGFLRFGRIQREYEKLRKDNEIQRAIIVGFHYEDVENVVKSFIQKVADHI